MDYTLPRNHCERFRLLHFTNKHVLNLPVLAVVKNFKAFWPIKYPQFYFRLVDQQETAASSRPITDNRFNTLGKALDEGVYDKLVKCLQAERINVCHRRDVRSNSVLGKPSSAPRFVVAQRSLSLRSRRDTWRSTHPGNASNLYRTSSMVKIGFINTIWDQCIGGIVRKHVLVTPLKTLDSEDGLRNPFRGWPGLACDIVYNSS